MSASRTEISVAFGRVLQSARQAQKLSQTRLAKRAYVDRTFLSQMERGIRQPSIQTLFRLAAALNMEPPHLLALTAQALSMEDTP